MDDLVTLHRLALGDLDRLVADGTAPRLDLPTPCARWSIADLLAHSIGQHRGFATAVRVGDADLTAYAPVPWSQSAWRASVTDLLDAFAGADLSGVARQVELRPHEPVPVRFVIAAQLLDSAVHAWDLARALGQPYAPAPTITTTILTIAQRIPDEENREAGGSFRHALASAHDDGAWSSVLRLLGRDPAWSTGTQPGS